VNSQKSGERKGGLLRSKLTLYVAMNDSVHQHIKNGYKKMNHLVPSQHKKDAGLSQIHLSNQQHFFSQLQDK
jgi:hypothetical protein